MKWILALLVISVAVILCHGLDDEYDAETPISEDGTRTLVDSNGVINTYNPKDCSLSPLPSFDEYKIYVAWKKLYKKSYKTEDDDQCAYVKVIFHNRECVEHNKKYKAGIVSYTRDLTQYSDLSFDEKTERILINDIPPLPTVKQGRQLPVLPPARDYVNYIEEGLVTPVGFQSKCGSCYGWSGAVALEGQLRKCKISNESVSVQMMVNCPTVGVWGCQSGWPFWVYRWQQISGIYAARKYPYRDRLENCTYNSADAIAFVQQPFQWDFTAINGNSSFIKQVVSAIGPVATIICVERSLLQYRTGVYKNPRCCKAVKHAVGIVGYGTDPVFGDYWLVKNSWGTGWGQNGFGKISRGDNTCISESQIQYAQVRDVNGRVCPFP